MPHCLKGEKNFILKIQNSYCKDGECLSQRVTTYKTGEIVEYKSPSLLGKIHGEELLKKTEENIEL